VASESAGWPEDLPASEWGRTSEGDSLAPREGNKKEPVGFCPVSAIIRSLTPERKLVGLCTGACEYRRNGKDSVLAMCTSGESNVRSFTAEITDSAPTIGKPWLLISSLTCNRRQRVRDQGGFASRILDTGVLFEPVKIFFLVLFCAASAKKQSMEQTSQCCAGWRLTICSFIASYRDNSDSRCPSTVGWEDESLLVVRDLKTPRSCGVLDWRDYIQRATIWRVGGYIWKQSFAVAVREFLKLSAGTFQQ